MLFPGEEKAIQQVKEFGRIYGYGNMIHHLKLAWSNSLRAQGIDESAADFAGGFVCPWCLVDSRTGKKVKIKKEKKK